MKPVRTYIVLSKQLVKILNQKIQISKKEKILIYASCITAFATLMIFFSTCLSVAVNYLLWQTTQDAVKESTEQTKAMIKEMDLSIRPFLGFKHVEGNITDKSIEGFYIIKNYGQISANDVKINSFIGNEDIEKLEDVYICPNQEYRTEYKLDRKVKNVTLKINIDYYGDILSDRKYLNGVFYYNPILKKFTIVSVKAN